jgi:ArsR family metal-binding transcriptional regulator
VRGDFTEGPMLLDQVDTFESFRPKMDSTKEVLHAMATFQADISPSFPYLDAELGGWGYGQRNQAILLKLPDGKWITLHPQKIAIRGIRDIEEAHALLAWIRGQINDIYERRETITPRSASQAGLKIMEILKLLPMTNCKACGYATCMAYAAALREGEISLEDCPPLWQEKYQKKRKKLQTYLESFGWRSLDAF